MNNMEILARHLAGSNKVRVTFGKNTCVKAADDGWYEITTIPYIVPEWQPIYLSGIGHEAGHIKYKSIADWNRTCNSFERSIRNRLDQDSEEFRVFKFDPLAYADPKKDGGEYMPKELFLQISEAENIIEDIRVDTRVMSDYPGYRRMMGLAYEELIRTKALASGNPIERALLACYCSGNGFDYRQYFDLYPHEELLYNVIKKYGEKARTLPDAKTSMITAVDLVKEIYRFCEELWLPANSALLEKFWGQSIKDEKEQEEKNLDKMIKEALNEIQEGLLSAGNIELKMKGRRKTEAVGFVPALDAREIHKLIKKTFLTLAGRDQIDTHSLHHVKTDPNQIFMAKEITRKKLVGLHICCDCSGSMGDEKKYKKTQSAIQVVLEAVKEVNFHRPLVKIEMYGFNTRANLFVPYGFYKGNPIEDAEKIYKSGGTEYRDVINKTETTIRKFPNDIHYTLMITDGQVEDTDVEELKKFRNKHKLSGVVMFPGREVFNWAQVDNAGEIMFGLQKGLGSLINM